VDTEGLMALECKVINVLVFAEVFVIAKFVILPLVEFAVFLI